MSGKDIWEEVRAGLWAIARLESLESECENGNGIARLLLGGGKLVFIFETNPCTFEPPPPANPPGLR